MSSFDHPCWLKLSCSIKSLSSFCNTWPVISHFCHTWARPAGWVEWGGASGYFSEKDLEVSNWEWGSSRLLFWVFPWCSTAFPKLIKSAGLDQSQLNAILRNKQCRSHLHILCYRSAQNSSAGYRLLWVFSSSHFDWIRIWSLINFVTILMSISIFTPFIHDWCHVTAIRE